MSEDEKYEQLRQVCVSYRNDCEKLENKIADLQAKLAESEKKFIVANNLRKNSDEVLLNYKTEKYGLDKTIQELRKMKLSLPEKEWYYKGFENCERQMSNHIADLTLEVKELKQQLAEKELSIEMLNQHLTDKALEVEKTDGMFRDCEADRKFEQEKKNIALKRVSELTKRLAEKEEQINMLEEHKFYADNIIQAYADKCKNHNQDKIALLEKVESYIKDSTYIKEPDYTNVCEYIRNLIKEIKGE